MMGAGLGSSSLYKSNPSVNTFGGNKKQGLPVSVGLDSWSDRSSRTYSVGTNRTKLFTINQLGGVGVGKSMFNVRYTNKDGAHPYNVIVLKDVFDTDVVPNLPSNYFLYGIQHLDEDNVRFNLQIPSPYFNSHKKFIKFYDKPTIYPIVQVINNQSLTLSYATFIQILINDGRSPSIITAIVNALKLAGYVFVAKNGSVYY